MKSQKLQNLEKRFGLASQQIDDVTDLVTELVGPLDGNLPVPSVGTDVEVVDTEVGTLTPIVEEPLFELDQLKLDFAMVRSNLIKLVNSGQRMLESAGVLDIADLKASQLDALSTLQNTIANNLKMMMEIYKDMAAIEKARRSLPAPKGGDVQAPVNMGTVNNTQVVFAGSTAELLEVIKNNGAPKQ